MVNKFISSLKYKNITATQFHPELSGEDGKGNKEFLNVNNKNDFGLP